MTIVISNVRQQEIGRDFVVIADVTTNGEKKSLSFKRSGNHPQLGDWEPRLDPFLVTILMPAMVSGQDIIVEGDIDQSILMAANSTIQQTLRLLDHKWKIVAINAQPRNQADQRFDPSLGAAIGMSCGIDSLYTHHFLSQATKTPEHLRPKVFFHNHIGAHLDRETFQKHLENAALYASEAGIYLVSVEADLNALFPGRFTHNHTIRNIAAAMTLDHLFASFIYSASEEIGRKPRLTRNSGISAIDPVFLPQFNTVTKRYLSFGFAATRKEKTLLVQTIPTAKQYLTVCTHAQKAGTPYRNCGVCSKCAQFLVIVDLMGTIDKFARIFDIGAFRDNRNRIFMRMLRASIGGRGSLTDHIFSCLSRQKEISDAILDQTFPANHTLECKNQTYIPTIIQFINIAVSVVL